MAPTLASTSVAPPPEAGLQSPDYSPPATHKALAPVLVDEDGQVHVQLVDVVGSAHLLRPVVEHLCERDNSPRSDLKTRARGSGGGPVAADQQRFAAFLIQNPIDIFKGEPLVGISRKPAPRGVGPRELRRPERGQADVNFVAKRPPVEANCTKLGSEQVFF